MYNFLPRKISDALNCLRGAVIYEIRLRSDRPVVVECSLGVGYLTGKGLSLSPEEALRISGDEISGIFFNVCERSFYAHTEKIRQGFITLDDGVRIGLCGECVVENGKILNLKNITSMNVRIPHEVVGCSLSVFKLIEKQLKNILIIAPVGVGKTTFARDIACEISHKLMKAVLVVDERNELFPVMSTACNVDCIRFAPKRYAFENGIRAMAPQVVVTDEISGEEDCLALKNAADSGVCVIATIHGGDMQGLAKRREFSLLKEIFDYFVILSGVRKKGELSAVFDAELNKIL